MYLQQIGVSINPSTWGEQDTGNKIKTGDINQWTASLINVVAIVGSAAAVIILIILGIKYMMGSAEDKAEYKKSLLPYVIGAVFVFGASALTGFIFNVMNNT